MLLDIVFQSGEFVNPDNSWWQELINTILGAAIGSGVTIWALYRTFRQDKRKDESKRIELQIEKIKYFRSLVSNTISNLKAQTEFVKNLAEEVQENSLELPLLEIRTFNDLERLVHKVNQEEYYHSYLGQFGATNDIIEEFRKIYSLLDFFDASIHSIKEMYKNSQAYDYERKIKYKELFESMTDYIAVNILTGSALINHPVLSKYINDAIVQFHEGHTDKSDIKYAHDNLVVTLKKPEVIGYGREIPQINELLMQLKNVTVLYGDIQNQNTFMASGFMDQYKHLKENLDKFEVLAKRLMNY